MQAKPSLPSNIIKDTKGATKPDDEDNYDDDAAYDEDFDEDEEENFKKTAADFAKQLNQLKTVNDKRKEIVEKMERDVKVNTNLGVGVKQPQSLQAKPYKLPGNTYDQDEDDEFDKEFNLLK